RAGLDYHEWASVQVHDDFGAAIAATGAPADCVFAFTTRGSRLLGTARFQAGDVLVFGSETAGLPPAIRDAFPAPQRLRLPMRPEQRSLNLSNAVPVAVFEAWRQSGYEGGQ